MLNGSMLRHGSMQATILLIEDDVSSAVALTIALQDQGFRALHATDGHQGVEYARAAQPDLILLDVMLPQMDSFAVCRILRQESGVPVVMLGACGHETNRVKSLETVADDYVVEPFSPSTRSGQSFQELVARMRALLGRHGLDCRSPSPPSDRIAVGDIVLDRATRQVWRADRLVELSPREYDLLCVLMENAGKAVSRQGLLDQVWGEGWIGDSHTLDVHICWLRRKLEDDASAPRYIQTVRGYGHRFMDPAESLADAT
jgi:DNA-binding response OmpR family regulator